MGRAKRLVVQLTFNIFLITDLSDLLPLLIENYIYKNATGWTLWSLLGGCFALRGCSVNFTGKNKKHWKTYNEKHSLVILEHFIGKRLFAFLFYVAALHYKEEFKSPCCIYYAFLRCKKIAHLQIKHDLASFLHLVKMKFFKK